MQEHNYVCNRCGGVATLAHHITPLNEGNVQDPTISLNWDNLEPLCIDCHAQHHSGGRVPVKQGLQFDDNGNLKEIIKVNK